MQGINIVGVQFRRAGKIYDFSAADIELAVGDHVIVDSERGPSLAQVVAVRFHNPVLKLDKKLKPILRKATGREMSKPARLSSEEVDDFTAKQIAKLKLNMRILKSEVQFGGNKVIVYFTAPGRVDFRELVKDLASGLRTRVELKQVGARDETKLLGGMGICGREYCCSSFLREFVPVSIRMAKNQNLALNPSKVSGGCGRLLCCLTYENDTYTHLRQVLPPKGTIVEILSQGLSGRVVKSDLLNQLVGVEDSSGQIINARVDDLKILERQANADDEGDGELAAFDSSAEEWAEDLDLDSLSKHLDERAPQETVVRPEAAPRERKDNSRQNKPRGERQARGKFRPSPGQGDSKPGRQGQPPQGKPPRGSQRSDRGRPAGDATPGHSDESKERSSHPRQPGKGHGKPKRPFPSRPNKKD